MRTKLFPVSSLEVILVDGGVNVALAGEEVQGIVHVRLGHGLLGLVEDGVPVAARLLHRLADDAVHQVVVLVAERLSRASSCSPSSLDRESTAQHGLRHPVGHSNLPVDLPAELPQLELGVDHLQQVSVVLRLGGDHGHLECHHVLLALVIPEGFGVNSGK